MPEFILNTEAAGAPFLNLDAFTQGFIEAAFFCETSQYPSDEFFGPEAQEAVTEGTSDGNIPSDSYVGDIDATSFVAIKNFCDEFQAKAQKSLELAYERDYDETQAGRDLYFTYAGHGTGYWDRDVLKNRDLGQHLSDLCGRGEINLSAYQSDKVASGFQIEFYIG